MILKMFMILKRKKMDYLNLTLEKDDFEFTKSKIIMLQALYSAFNM